MKTEPIPTNWHTTGKHSPIYDNDEDESIAVYGGRTELSGSKTPVVVALVPLPTLPTYAAIAEVVSHLIASAPKLQAERDALLEALKSIHLDANYDKDDCVTVLRERIETIDNIIHAAINLVEKGE